MVRELKHIEIMAGRVILLSVHVFQENSHGDFLGL